MHYRQTKSTEAPGCFKARSFTSTAYDSCPNRTVQRSVFNFVHSQKSFMGSCNRLFNESAGTASTVTGTAPLPRYTGGAQGNAANASEIFNDCSVHRMGFYVASNGRFLAVHWLGTRTGDPGSRIVREIYGPDSHGPVYLIKANKTGAIPGKTFPHYSTSSDEAFKAACDELYNNRLYQEQWHPPPSQVFELCQSVAVPD
jgi:hypothetical protein